MVLLSSCNVLAQSVLVQRGITYRYNGKNPRIPIGGVYVKTATSPNGVVSDEGNGTFALKLQNIKMGDRLGRATVSKAGLMIFNQQAVDEWSARKEPLKLILCDANQFQKQKNNLIAIGRNQAEKKYKKRLAELEKRNKAQQLTLDEYYAKLDSINRERDNAEKHMDEYADMFARIDESEVDTLAQRAIELFNQGQLEEAIKLFEQGNYLKKIDDALKVKAQAVELRQKADSAEVLANKDIEEYKKSIQAQISAYKMSNEWDKAGELLKGLADKLQTLDAIWDYASFSQNQNQFVVAEKYYKLCINILNTTSSAYEPYMAAIYNNLGSLYSNTQRFTESEQMHKSALKIHKSLVESNPQVYEPNLATSYNNLGNLYSDTQCFAESEEMHKSALEIRKRLAELNPQAYEPDLAASYLNLGNLYCNTQRFAESEETYKSALEIRKRLAESNPQAYNPDLATSYLNLGNLYSDTQRFAESEETYKSALEIHKRLAESNPQAYEPDLAASYLNLAVLYHITQHFTESGQMYKSALEIYKCLAEENPRLYGQQQAKCLYWFADSQIKQEKYAEAMSPLEKALEFYKKEAEQGKSIDYYTTIMSWLHQLYGQEKKHSQAYLCFKQNIPLLKTLYQSDKSNYTELLNGILVAQSFYAIFEKQYVEAETYSRDALEVDSTNHIAYSNLAPALLFQGKYLEAEMIYCQYKSELREGFLSDFEEFSKTGIIPKNREEDVEKIKQLLLKE